jgi:hypothetical protein
MRPLPAVSLLSNASVRRPTTARAAALQPTTTVARRFGTTLRRQTLAWGLWACAWAALCGTAVAETRVVNPTDARELQLALASAADGDVIDLLPGVYQGEPLVLEGRRLTLRGVARSDKQRTVFQAPAKPGMARAMLTVRGGEVTLVNLEFKGMRSSNAAGAGVRLEGGRLVVRRCRFVDNETGLAAGNDERAEVDVQDSLFGPAPQVEGSLPHLIDLGRIARFSISGSRLQGGFEGHMLKSRARDTRITYNLLRDGAEGQASHEIDLPVGGHAVVLGNIIIQAPRSQNPVVVAYGAEGRHWDTNKLYLAHNTLINQKWTPAWFLRVFDDRLPADTQVYGVNNLTLGGGVLGWGAPGHFEGNRSAWAGVLTAPDLGLYDLPLGSWLQGAGSDPRRIGGLDLSPRAEFTPPLGTRAIPPLTRWIPGAVQR